MAKAESVIVARAAAGGDGRVAPKGGGRAGFREARPYILRQAQDAVPRNDSYNLPINTVPNNVAKLC